MRNFWRYVMTGVGFAMLVTIVLMATGWGSAVASNIGSVFVSNTSSNPVPVTPTGTVPVHEQGTAQTQEQNLDANGNIKVHEQGTANVNVTGTPSVGLAASGNTVKIDPNANTVQVQAGSGPLQTQAADNPAFHPVLAEDFLTTGEADQETHFYAVPAHEELVIEQVSIEVGGFASGTTVQHAGIVVNVGGTLAPFFLPMSNSSNGRASIGDVQTRIYADPGTQVYCFMGLNQSDPGTQGRCDISGYLVPLG